MRKGVAVAKPFLSERHTERRLAWALEHRDWTVDDWSKVIWSDEASICLGKLAQRRYVLRSPQEKYDHDNLVPAFKNHKQSAMVWGCFFGTTLGPLQYFPRGAINAQSYVNMLETSLLPLIDHADGLTENLIGDRQLLF